MKVYRDLKNSLDTAREEGREEGIEIVLQILSLAEQRKNTDEISTQIGISQERVAGLLKKLGKT